MNRTARLRRLGPVTALEDRCNPVIVDFTLNAAASSATLGGDVNGAPIQQQGPGSLTTTYTGTIRADVDFWGNTIQFLQTGSAVSANDSGSWQPLVGGAAGSAPANYGGKVALPLFQTGLVAPRGIVVTFDSAPLTLSGAGPTKTFASTQNFTITAGTSDYNAGLFGVGTEQLAGNTATNQSPGAGSVTDLGWDMYDISVVFDVTINDTVGGLPATFTIKGAANGSGKSAVPAAKIQSVVVNGGANNRSTVTEVTVTFDQVVTLPTNPADAFQLKRNSDNATVSLAATVTNTPTTSAKLTFTGGAVEGASLANGRYTLTAVAWNISGGQFDGNGDGAAGDDFVLVGDPALAPKLYRFYGDADGDGDVDAVDFGGFRSAFGGSTNLTFDADGDGDVDAVDFGRFRQQFGGAP